MSRFDKWFDEMLIDTSNLKNITQEKSNSNDGLRNDIMKKYKDKDKQEIIKEIKEVNLKIGTLRALSLKVNVSNKQYSLPDRETFNKLIRNLLVKRSILESILNEHNNKHDPEYIELSNIDEVSKEDDSSILDSKMLSILKERLLIGGNNIKISPNNEKMLKILDEQNKRDLQRKEEYNKRVNAIKSMINNYDSNKSELDKDYVPFVEQIEINEDEDYHEIENKSRIEKLNIIYNDNQNLNITKNKDYIFQDNIHPLF